jgi:hypothetical protein
MHDEHFLLQGLYPVTIRVLKEMEWEVLQPLSVVQTYSWVFSAWETVWAP